jgi:hypothetical protein
MRFRQPDLHPQSWNFSARPLNSHIPDTLSTFHLADFRHPHSTTGERPPSRISPLRLSAGPVPLRAFPKEFPYE